MYDRYINCRKAKQKAYNNIYDYIIYPYINQQKKDNICHSGGCYLSFHHSKISSSIFSPAALFSSGTVCAYTFSVMLISE